MSTDSICDLVKKLLRLARCKAAAPGEAANALNRALELIERHHIDLAALDIDEETERIVCERIYVSRRMDLIKRLVNGILINYFPVRTCISRPHLAVIGFEHDVAIAGYVFDFLVGACQRAVKAYAAAERKNRRKVTTLKKQNFIQGWISGVASNLRRSDRSGASLEDNKTALVLAKRDRLRDEKFQELFPSTKQVSHRKPRRLRSAIVQGYRDGSRTQINTPLNSPSETLLLQ